VDEFRFSTELKVRFSETDAQGVAHHAAYLDWLEVARVEYLARFPGGYQGLRDRGIEATTLEAHVRYRAPARFDDVLVIRARCGDVRGARFRFDYVIERAGEPIADGWTSHACVDARTLRPTRMPGWLKEELSRAEMGSAGTEPAAWPGRAGSASSSSP
jgi:acyl-CoA thioester hydrolase